MELNKENGKLNVQQGSIINIQGYKHDGTLYRQWNGVKVLEVNPNEIILFMFKTKVLESSAQRWVVREPTIWFFPIDEWYNTTGLIRGAGTYYYTNLASPPIFEDNTLKFIDYDLDIKSYPDQPIKIVDKKEFARHSIEMNYPKNLVDKIDKDVRKIIELIVNEDSNFDPEVMDHWKGELINSMLLGKKFVKLMQAKTQEIKITK